MALATALEPSKKLAIPQSVLIWSLILIGLSACQFLIGTDPVYVALVAAFNILWLTTFYMMGGITSVLGGSVFWLGFQHIFYSQVAKVIVWQRPDTPLLEPTQTITVYVIGMASVLAAALFMQLKPVRSIRPLLVEEIRPDRLKMLAIGFTILMVVRYVGFAQFGRVLSVLSNFEFLTPLAVTASTAYVVIASDKKKCLGALTIIGLVIPLLSGIAFGQRKEASFAVVLFVVTAYAYGFRYKIKHYLVGIALAYFFQFILFPYALYARGHISGSSFITNIGSAWEILIDVIGNPKKYQEKAKEAPPISDYDATRLAYFGTPEPTSDRFSVLITTDALVHVTDRIGTTGWRTIEDGFWMVVPRAFHQDKTQIGTSNWIAQRAPGVVGDSDFKTSITLGFFSESYVAFQWLGICFIPFCAALAFFFVYRLTMRDSIYNNLWACAMVVTLPHSFSEGTIQQIILRVLQDAPLIAATGLTFMIVSNTLSRHRNLQQETVEPARAPDELPEIKGRRYA